MNNSKNKYIVVSYGIIDDYISTRTFEDKKSALRFISDNKIYDKLNNCEEEWFYSLIEIEVSRHEE